MKVIYYEKKIINLIHIHANSNSNLFYVPSKEIVLYIEKNGTFGNKKYSITNTDFILSEAKKIENGKIENTENTFYSNIIEFNYDEQILEKIIKYATIQTLLESKIKNGIEDLLSSIPKSH